VAPEPARVTPPPPAKLGWYDGQLLFNG
jgi:hypothetical protein